jgi:glutaconate CoA-transferase subunit A
VALWGITGIQKEAVLSVRHAIVTVEEVVASFKPRLFQIVLPSVAVDAIAVVPHGAHGAPSGGGRRARDRCFG